MNIGDSRNDLKEETQKDSEQSFRAAPPVIPGANASDMFAAARSLTAAGYSRRELLFKFLELHVAGRIKSLFFKFREKGTGVLFHPSCTVDGAAKISLGNNVWIQRGVWLCVPLVEIPRPENLTGLIIGDGTRIGPNCTISAASRIDIGQDVLFGPNVTVLDHKHCYDNPDMPVSRQGISSGEGITIEKNCWFGTGAVVYSSRSHLTIGRNSVVAANSFVTKNIPPCSVAAGSPARIIAQYNRNTNQWEHVDEK